MQGYPTFLKIFRMIPQRICNCIIFETSQSYLRHVYSLCQFGILYSAFP